MRVGDVLVCDETIAQITGDQDELTIEFRDPEFAGRLQGHVGLLASSGMELAEARGDRLRVTLSLERLARARARAAGRPKKHFQAIYGRTSSEVLELIQGQPRNAAAERIGCSLSTLNRMRRKAALEVASGHGNRWFRWE